MTRYSALIEDENDFIVVLRKVEGGNPMIDVFGDKEVAARRLTLLSDVLRRAAEDLVK